MSATEPCDEVVFKSLDGSLGEVASMQACGRELKVDCILLKVFAQEV